MRPGFRSPQQGLTLVELMVALVIGLLAVLAAGAMLVWANRSFASQTDLASVEDNGRFAIELIGRAARQTAYVDWERDDAPELAAQRPARIAGLDAQSLERTSAALTGTRAAVAHGSDVLALRFAGAGAAPAGDGSVLSCAGFGVPAHEEGWSIFYVADSATGDAELRCKYRGREGWSSDAVASGVDSFQVLYGLDSDTPPDGLANAFVSASAINALDAALAPEGDTEAARLRDFNRRTHWKRVTCLKVALLLHGGKHALADRASAVYHLFGPAYSEAAGAQDTGVLVREEDMAPRLRAQERRQFVTTIVLRNPPG